MSSHYSRCGRRQEGVDNSTPLHASAPPAPLDSGQLSGTKNAHPSTFLHASAPPVSLDESRHRVPARLRSKSPPVEDHLVGASSTAPQFSLSSVPTNSSHSKASKPATTLEGTDPDTRTKNLNTLPPIGSPTATIPTKLPCPPPGAWWEADLRVLECRELRLPPRTKFVNIELSRGAVRAVDTGLVPSGETMAELQDQAGVEGAVGSEQAQLQLSGGVRRKDRYYYWSRRGSGTTVEASGTTSVVPEGNFSHRGLEEVGSCALSASTDTSLVVYAFVPARVDPPSPQRAFSSSSSSSLAASEFLRPAAARVPVTTGNPLEVDLGLLHQVGLGLLSEGAGDTVRLLPVGDDAAVASSSAATSTGAGQVPGHHCPQALESNPRQTTWASRLQRRPAAVTLPPPASPSSAILRARSHEARTQHLGKAAAIPLWGGRLGQRDPVEGEDREGVPGTPLREAHIWALREAVEEEPPEKFQGQRHWAVSREAISGADYLRPMNDYIREVLFLDQRR
ncbi:hypothetical protein HPB47_014175 [Ixodes persulcatus]|uniref:Uncharacterized protein n=1 Tax=Ixodes persulcatus TaxID=34615 RepID=A0AC60QWK6_IXOPE|nr:hypothetical protein HPB47_014175 [Ixodes persulcatus]